MRNGNTRIGINPNPTIVRSTMTDAIGHGFGDVLRITTRNLVDKACKSTHLGAPRELALVKSFEERTKACDDRVIATQQHKAPCLGIGKHRKHAR